MASIEERLTEAESLLRSYGESIKQLGDTLHDLVGNIDPKQLKFLNNNLPEMFKKFEFASILVDTHVELVKTNETGNEMVKNSGKFTKDVVAEDFTSSKAMNIKDYFMSKMIDNPIVIPSSKTTFQSWIYSRKEMIEYLSNDENKQTLRDIKQKAMDSGFDENAINTKYNKAMYGITWNYLKSKPCAPVTTIYDKIVVSHTKYKDEILIKEQKLKGDQL